MKTGFKDPIKPRKEEPKSRLYPKDMYAAPKYDERSSCFVNCGTYHGEGFKQPVGTKDERRDEVVPKGRVDTMSYDPYDGYR